MKKKCLAAVIFAFAVLSAANTVYAIFTGDILEECLPVEYTKYLAIGDGYVMLEKDEAGFSENSSYYGVYDYVNQAWIMEYQQYDGYMDSVKCVGDKMFAYSIGGTTYLVNPDMQNTVPLEYDVEPDELQFFGKHAVVKVQRFEDDYDSCDVFVVDENGEFYETGLVYEITEDGEMAKGDLRNCALNENYAVYIYEKTDFVIYDIQNDSVLSFSSPDYAEKMCVDFRENLSASICGNQYLALMNMEGNDGKNYYAVLDFFGNSVVGTTQCDYVTSTEKGNLIVKNGEQTDEIKVADIMLAGEQKLTDLALIFQKKDCREEEAIGMDRKGNVYKNTVEYSNIFYLDEDPPYDQADLWYLGGNYSSMQGIWYFPEGTLENGFTNVRLVGDGNVIYESETLNAQNQSVEFNVDVTGIRELQLEYNGSADLNGVMLGIADGRLIPVGVQADAESAVREKPVQADSQIQDPDPQAQQSNTTASQVQPASVMLYDLYSYIGNLHKMDIIDDNLGNTYYHAIAFFSEETAIYDIGQKYSTLTGKLAVTKADSGPLDSEQNGYVRIYGDDVLLWEDCTLNSYTKPYDFSVDITGVTDLKITANGYSANLGWDYLAVILENVSLQ